MFGGGRRRGLVGLLVGPCRARGRRGRRQQGPRLAGQQVRGRRALGRRPTHQLLGVGPLALRTNWKRKHLMKATAIDVYSTISQ